MIQKILITGATGFIGNALTQTLTEQNFNVLAGVRQQSADFPYSQIELGDLSNKVDLTSSLQGVDVVIHLAARAHIMHDSAPDPIAAFRKINTTGTLSLALQAAEAGVKRFIFISSIKVNGEMTLSKAPFQPELTEPPTDPYALSKYEAENGLLSLAKNTGMQVVIIRPPLVYGPGVKANFSRMIKWLKAGKPLPFALINNQRSLLALDNLVNFISLCIDHPKAANEIFLIADADDVSTPQLLQKIAQAYHKNARLLPVPVSLLKLFARLIGKQDQINRLVSSLQLDSTKATDLLGWQPIISIDTQLKKIAKSDNI